MKNKNIYACNSCGAVYSKWAGQCSECGEWNCISEKTTTTSKNSKPFVNLDSSIPLNERLQCQYDEFNRVCGGGIVNGSIILIGGDPGVGKSTLLLHIASTINSKVLYVSGEESIEQISLRAKRLNVNSSNMIVGSETKVDQVLDYIRQNDEIKVVIIDSIHTMRMNTVESVSGSVNQIRACTQEIMDFAKNQNITFILVGHVTKDGIIAGPKLLEHMVDVVLYLENSNSYRFLRSIKNRFGSTSEVGIFEMTSKGLIEVKNPSTLFLSFNRSEQIGSCVFPSIEGERPILAEIQTLISKSNFQNPRRSVVGWETNRVITILAVLESICKLSFTFYDVYVNIAGGFRLSETAADLAIAASLISSIKNIHIPNDTTIFGEVSLSGEVRQVQHQNRRLMECINIGYKNIYMPYEKNLDIDENILDKVNIKFVKNIHELMNIMKNFS